jgi:phosphatidylserine/phosphatidylglycerophosphate/cardiolipin synthase-like enzyme
VSRQQLIDAVAEKDQAWKYDVLPDLEQLEQDYPDLFQLKLLGTHEKYIVCDDQFAVLGSQDILTSSTKNAERELGLLTNDPRIIQDLLELFDGAQDLEKEASA